jgi:hypothetical protein
VLGTAITFTTAQAAQVAGFGVGGVVVGIFGIHLSLAADALTFVLSAALTVAWVRRRPAVAHVTGRSGFSMAGVKLVFGAAALRTPMLLGWLAAFTDVYEGVAVPLATALVPRPRLNVTLLIFNLLSVVTPYRHYSTRYRD